jgi:acyl-CoA thioesterase
MNIKEFISHDKFAAFLGIKLLEAENGRAKAKMEIREEHLNAASMAHGGVIFTLADLAVAAASNSHGNIALSISTNIFFVKAFGRGTLYAEAKEISRNETLATYSVSVINDSNDLISELQAMVYRKKLKYEEIISKY